MLEYTYVLGSEEKIEYRQPEKDMNMHMASKKKALALLSGGLDSRLAVRMMQEQNIDMIALNYVTPFCNCTAKTSCMSEARKASREYGIPLKVIPMFDDFIKVVQKPKYSYGRGLNPCLDCRILMFKKAASLMDEEGASFLITGEVLGERPMSQRLDAIATIERDSGLTGLIVRPLSAQLFEPTIPEKEGWIDRSKLLKISGRSRRPQIKLAAELGVDDYPCPAGGCLLTEKHFADKLRHLFELREDPSKNDVLLLKVGRHFSGDSGATQIVVGRDENENKRLEDLSTNTDWLVTIDDWTGPTTLVRGDAISDLDLEKAATLAARYGKGRDEDQVDSTCRFLGETERVIKKRVSPLSEPKAKIM